MLNTILTKTLYERRWSLLIWFFAITASVLSIMIFFPVLRDSLGTALKDVPESMQGLLGDAATYQTITGYVDLQVIAQMVFLTIIMGIIAGTSLIAGDENNGTLQTLLAQPVSRTKVYLQKLAALAVITLVASFAIFTGVMLGALFIGESLSMTDMVLASVMIWVLTFFFASIAYGVGAATGKRSIAGVVTGFYAFVAYMLTALAGLSDELSSLNYGSPFYYLTEPSVLLEEFSIRNALILLTGAILFIVIGWLRFRRRDINL